jgi:hypothetical protein
MFDRLFVRSDALTRQISAPLADERRQYLAKARKLLSIADSLKLAHRSQNQISLQEIDKVASRWSRKRCSRPSERLLEGFVSETIAWLRFLGRCKFRLRQRRYTTRCWSSSKNSWRRSAVSLRRPSSIAVIPSGHSSIGFLANIDHSI